MIGQSGFKMNSAGINAANSKSSFFFRLILIKVVLLTVWGKSRQIWAKNQKFV
jgi:hypothetical protein